VASIKRRFVIILELQTATGAHGNESRRRRDNTVDVAGDEHAHLSRMAALAARAGKRDLRR
jgi:hypothetical protein